MATPTIKTKVEIDGEKEFKSAISEINSGLKVLNSEMRKVTAEYQDNANSVEALTAKGDVLERTLTTQKEKVETLRKTLEAVAKKYGESDEKTMKWQASLNDAEAAVANTEAAIRRNNEALEEAQRSGTGFGTMLDGITQKFGISLPESVSTSLNSIGAFSTGAIVAIGAVTAAVAALIKVEQQLINLTRESAAEADNILTLVQITGFDAESIQELQYASELIDVSFDTIKSSMTKMKRSLDDAASGTGDVAEAYKQLGVRVKDSSGDFRDAEDIFYDLIDALGQVENATERDNLSMKVFGKSAEDLNPLIVQGSAVLRQYTEEAHTMSAVLTEEQLAALGAVDDEYQRMIQTQSAVKNQISAELAPAVAQFYGSWAELMASAGQALIDSGIIEGLGGILKLFNSLIDVVTAIVETSFPNLKGVFEDIGDVAYKIGLRISTLVDIIKTMVNIVNPVFDATSNGNRVISTETTRAYKANAYEDVEGFTWNGTSYVGNKYNAAGDSNWQGGWTWVGENGPELVSLPAGSQINNAQDSRNMGGDVYNISIDARSVKEFNDIVRIAQQSRVTARMRG